MEFTMPLLGANGQPVTSSPATQEPENDVPSAPTRVTTAFLVYQLPNGQWVASEDLATAIVPSRRPVPDDLIAGTENVKNQIIARKAADMAAQATIQTQMAIGRQVAEAQQNAQVQAMLAKGGKK